MLDKNVHELQALIIKILKFLKYLCVNKNKYVSFNFYSGNK